MGTYKRVLLKLSGEALMAEKDWGIDAVRLNDYATEIKEVTSAGTEVGLVIGGGNIFRGVAGVGAGFDRVKGDYMGMLATVINGLALQSAFQSINAEAIVFSAIRMDPITEFYSLEKVHEAFKQKKIVIFVAGTGNPFFTTDTASALRAVEIGADVMLKGTRVDGIYTADPEKDPTARRFDTIHFDEALERNLKIMDAAAFTLCRENNLPVVVFDMNKKGNLQKLISGEKIGTLVKI